MVNFGFTYYCDLLNPIHLGLVRSLIGDDAYYVSILSDSFNFSVINYL